MTATSDDIRVWLMRGKLKGATHVIIVCDTFDWEDYPEYVFPTQRVTDCITEIRGKPMNKIMEVYNLSLPLASQLEEARTWNL